MDVIYEGLPFTGIMSKFYNVSAKSFYSFFKAEGEKYADFWSDAANVFNPSINTNWVSNRIDNANITITFKKHLLKVDYYTFRARVNYSENMPRGWKFEGSNDKVNWDLLHNETDYSDLKEADSYKTYQCKYHGAYKHFRITQTQINWSYGLYFHVSRLEFFGTIFSSLNPFIKRTCLMRKKSSLVPLLFLVIVK